MMHRAGRISSFSIGWVGFQDCELAGESIWLSIPEAWLEKDHDVFNPIAVWTYAR